jgi:polyisoprenoid-binding protein YceI
MNTQILKILGATSIAVLTAAMVAPDAPLRLNASSRLWVAGTSTVRSFECEAKTIDAKIESAVTDAIRAVLAGENGVGPVELRVPASDLDCNNGTMNGHMYKAIKSAEHPSIVFRLDSYDLAPAAGVVALTMRGTLNLGGVEKPIVLQAQVESVDSVSLKVAGTYELNMKDYGLKPPTLMLGALKVGEKVNVKFELNITQ